MKLNIISIIAIVLLAFIAENSYAQHCGNVAFNRNSNGLMVATLYTYKGSTRVIYGSNANIPNASKKMPYSGTLDHNLESIQFGGNVMVKLRKKGDKKWTKYYGMEPCKEYDVSSYPFETIEFDPKRPQWIEGDEYKVEIDDREYGFAFTQPNYAGKVMMISTTVGGCQKQSDNFKSVVVQQITSSNKSCTLNDFSSWHHHDKNIEPANVITILNQ